MTNFFAGVAAGVALNQAFTRGWLDTPIAYVINKYKEWTK